jgi:hypothetical protein
MARATGERRGAGVRSDRAERGSGWPRTRNTRGSGLAVSVGRRSKASQLPRSPVDGAIRSVRCALSAPDPATPTWPSHPAARLVGLVVAFVVKELHC